MQKNGTRVVKIHYSSHRLQKQSETWTYKSYKNKPGVQRVQALADISRSRYDIIGMKPVHRLQICLIVHN